MKNTKENIAAKALELFNERGIEYVGMRELAAALGTRIGNITYYFPTKDELVYHIAKSYQELNSSIHNDYSVHTPIDFLRRFEKLFFNQVQYRCLLLSFVHLMEHNPFMATDYDTIRKKRTSSNETAVCNMVEGGYLKMNEKQAGTLVSTVNIIGRFWLSESILSGYARAHLHKQIGSYLSLLANLMKPYATAKGLKDIERWEK